MSRVKSTKDTIQPKYQPDPESLVDSIAFGPVSKVEAWNDKLQIMKDHTPASCDKARELYKGIASGIKGERRWKSPGRRMDAAKALILSDKLQWIPEKCNPKAGKKKKSRTKRHAVKSHKMKSKHKHTRKMNRKKNNRRKTIRRNTRRTRRRNVRRTKKRMMGGDTVSKGVYPSGDLISRPGEIFLDADGLKIEHESSGTHTMKKSKITSVTRFWWFGYGNGYKITTDGKGKIPARYWVPCNDDGSIDGLDESTLDALKQLIPPPEPAPEPEPEPEPEPAAAPVAAPPEPQLESATSGPQLQPESEPAAGEVEAAEAEVTEDEFERFIQEGQISGLNVPIGSLAAAAPAKVQRKEAPAKAKKLAVSDQDIENLQKKRFSLRKYNRQCDKLVAKAKKKEKKERAKIEAAINRGDKEAADMHAENTIRHKNEALLAEKWGSKIEGQIATLTIKIKQCIAAENVASATSKLHEENMGTEQDLENIEEFLREADTQSELLKLGLEAVQTGNQEKSEELLELAGDEAMFDAAEKTRSKEKDAEFEARLDKLRGRGGGLKKKKKKTKTKKRKRMRA